MPETASNPQCPDASSSDHTVMTTGIVPIRRYKGWIKSSGNIAVT
jgi:hypothetical protein